VGVDRAGLRVPHPELAERPFLCALLAELDPTLRLPDGRLLAELGGIFYIGSRSAS
jgi:7,8-dihydro-6-hydroxymethylpterin-pyrophosphokinase